MCVAPPIDYTWCQFKMTGLDIGYVPAVPHAFLRLSGQFGPLQFSGQWIFYLFFIIFLVLRMSPLFLLGIGKTRKATLIRTYFFVIIRTKVCNFTREIINSRRKNNLVHYMFLGGQWVFWGASGFSDSLAPRASGCHSPMSRPG